MYAFHIYIIMYNTFFNYFFHVGSGFFPSRAISNAFSLLISYRDGKDHS